MRTNTFAIRNGTGGQNAFTLIELLVVIAILAGMLLPALPAAAQNTNRTPGTVVSWGSQVIPYVAPRTRFTAIAAGRAHSLALKTDGTVVAWGANWAGQSTVPEGLTGVVAIAAGDDYSLALKADGTVVAWGTTVPGGLTGVVAIAAGPSHSLALVAETPAIVIQASGNNILLSWPLWAQGFAVQSTTNLADENSWTPVLTVPVVEGSQNRVTDPIAGPARFCRLER